MKGLLGRRGRWLTRLAIGTLVVGLDVVGAAPVQAGVCDPPVTSPIACENSQPGTAPSVWDLGGGAGSSSIQGFATDTSVNAGGTISFKINSSNLTSYSIPIYRIGYYQGNGARLVATVSPSVQLPQTQPACRTDSNPTTGIADCGNWTVSASWTVPATAVSGVYVARPTAASGAASHIIFVVRNDASTSTILFRTNDTTWQAYNDFGGNNLYYGTAPSSDGRAYKVSFNRPYNNRSEGSGYGTSNFFFYAEYPMIRWLESNGYDVSYMSELDPERQPSLLAHHRTILTAGHDEYWSAGQRAAFESARDAGVNLALLTGNDMFWKVRFANSIDGSNTPMRTLVCYKETKSEQPIDPADPPTWTGTWRDPTVSPPADGGRPENQVIGQIFMVNRGSADIKVPFQYSRLRLWRNTPTISHMTSGSAPVDLGTQTVGYEWDEDLDNGFRPAGTIDLSSVTASVTDLLQDYGNTYANGTATHNLTMYRAASGALVFAAGTVQWAWGLDTNHDTAPDTGPTSPSADMQQAMVNLLADMGAQPATLQSGLVAAAASSDTTAPSSSISAPAPGASVSSGSTVTISGTASDPDSPVAGVEVTVDNGATWHPATGTSSWSYAWHPTRAGTATIRSRAVDDSGRLETPSAGFSVSVTGSPAFISKSTVQNATTLAAPPGIVAGDLLLASLQVAANPVTVSGPSGWTLALDTVVNSSFHAQVWYKIATASEPGPYTWTVPAGTYTDIAVLDYANVSQSAPIDAAAGRDGGVTKTPTTPSVTTSGPGDMLVAIFQGADNGIWTAGSGMTQRYNYDSTTAQDAIQAAAGASGTKTATNSTQTSQSAQLVALKPLPSDTQPPTVAVTAPASGATVGGNAVTLTASASDNVAVASVQFSVDGATVGSPITSAPYTTSWDSTTVANGSHTITARAVDTSGNAATSSAVSVTVSNVPPAISGVAASSITASGAIIGWTTDQAASSQVEYGTTTSYGSSTALDPSLVTSHSQALSGLAAGTTYHYRVKSRSGSGVLGTSGDFTFATAPPPPPTISGVAAGSITASGATITWTTSTPASSQVEYGLDTTYGSSTTPDATLVTSHSQALSGLAASTTYHYRVKGTDAFSQPAVSGDFTFTTPGPPPVISGVVASGITTTGATIGWTTDVAASSQVEYGTTTAYGSSTTLDAALVTSHSQALSGLQPGTQYHFRVRSTNAGGSLAVSGDFVLTTATPPPPVISNVQAGSITSSGATITWTTDVASDTTVRYGTTTSYGSTASTAGAVTGHTQALSGLAASTTYHYQVQSKDAFGQVSSSSDFTFTTAVSTTPPSFRSASTVTNGTTVSKPAGVAAGDLLLATIEVDADPVTVTPPNGWTLLIDTVAAQGTANAWHAQVWYKVATASEPASYTWTVGGSPWVDIGLAAYSGVSTTNPFDAFSGRDAGVTATPSTDAVTTTSPNDLVVGLFIDFNTTTWTAGSGTTKRYDFDGNTSEDVVQASPGSTGAKTATAAVTGSTTAQIVALRPR